MNGALEADYYDHAIADEASPHMLSARSGPYANLYRAAFGLIRDTARQHGGPVDVFDLGCGTGRFASLLLSRTGEDQPIRTYAGYDFAAGMILEARRYNADRPPGPYTFRQLDVRTDDLDRVVGRSEPDGVVVMLEVLEHLENDLRLLCRLPVDARLIVSVPSFDSRAHVRHFPHVGDALARYSEVLEINSWQRVWLPERTGYFHLMEGVLRP